jgi:hypothetical protein
VEWEVPTAGFWEAGGGLDNISEPQGPPSRQFTAVRACRRLADVPSATDADQCASFNRGQTLWLRFCCVPIAIMESFAIACFNARDAMLAILAVNARGHSLATVPENALRCTLDMVTPCHYRCFNGPAPIFSTRGYERIGWGMASLQSLGSAAGAKTQPYWKQQHRRPGGELGRGSMAQRTVWLPVVVLQSPGVGEVAATTTRVRP